MMQIELTTTAGLESIVHDELRDCFQNAGLPAPKRLESGLRGHGLWSIDAPWEEISPVVLSLRSIHHVLRPITRIPWRGPLDVEDLGCALDALDYEFLGTETPFSLDLHLHGDIPVPAEVLEAEIGKRIAEASGVSLSPSATRTLRVDVQPGAATLALQETSSPLSFRHGSACRKALLKPNVAYAMLRLAGAIGGEEPPPRTIADPSCDNGVLLIEAAEVFPEAILYGCDGKPAAVQATQRVLDQAGQGHRAQIVTRDAFTPGLKVAGGVDLILTCPPLGEMTSGGKDPVAQAQRWFRDMRHLLSPTGRMAVVTHKTDAFRLACTRSGFRIQRMRTLDSSGVLFGIFAIVSDASF